MMMASLCEKVSSCALLRLAFGYIKSAMQCILYEIVQNIIHGVDLVGKCVPDAYLNAI